MAFSISISKMKEKLAILFMIFLAIITLFYLYLSHLQENYNSARWTGDRCLSELNSVKYQLTVVTEYKNHIDILLVQTQKAHESDKARFEDVMDSCAALKQQSSICQGQFEDLQSECKRVKEDYYRVSKELKKLKPAG